MRARADWRFMANRGGQALTRLLYGLRSTSAGGRKRCFTPQSKALAREWSCYCISAEDGLATWKSAIQSRRVGTPGRRAVSGVKGDNAQILVRDAFVGWQRVTKEVRGYAQLIADIGNVWRGGRLRRCCSWSVGLSRVPKRGFWALKLGWGTYFGEVTVLEVIKKSTEFLEKKGVESPRLQVELLLAHTMGVQRMGLYLNFEKELTSAQLDQVREQVRRRGQREPLQHIVGSTSFCGLEIAVDRRVLVPRPETELLAEMGWEFLNGAGSCPPAGLDFGTGSGCLAIALAVKCPAARVTAVDVSVDALALAKENAARNGAGERIEFVQGDGFAAVKAGSRFDLLVANPPYVASAEIATLEPEVRDYDPHLALNGGEEGLDFYRRLAAEAGEFLRPGGKIMLELGDGQAGAVEKMFAGEKWIVEGVRADYSGRLRILTARREG